jgi:hypothetical protein
LRNQLHGSALKKIKKPFKAKRSASISSTFPPPQQSPLSQSDESSDQPFPLPAETNGYGSLHEVPDNAGKLSDAPTNGRSEQRLFNIPASVASFLNSKTKGHARSFSADPIQTTPETLAATNGLVWQVNSLPTPDVENDMFVQWSEEVNEGCIWNMMPIGMRLKNSFTEF